MTVRQWAAVTYINGTMKLYFYQHGKEIESIMFTDGYILPHVTRYTALEKIDHVDAETGNNIIIVRVYLKG